LVPSLAEPFGVPQTACQAWQSVQNAHLDILNKAIEETKDLIWCGTATHRLRGVP
jgi:hypothetical protein